MFFSRTPAKFTLVLIVIATWASVGCEPLIKINEDVIMENSIALTIHKSEITANALQIQAKLTNHGKGKVYYVAHLCSGWDDDGIPILESAPAYRVIGDKQVRLIRSFIPVPDDIDVEVVQYPLFAELNEGESVEIQLKLPLPTYPYTPYDFEEFDRESAETTQLAWSLEIGYVSGKAFLAATPEEITTTTGEKGLQVFSIDHASIQSVKYTSTETILVLQPRS